MNSYPPELLTQLAPVMFAAGLDVPATPTPDSDVSASPPVLPSQPQDPFSSLVSRLRDALLAQRKVAIWQPDKTKSFQTVLVDRAVRFPPRKIQAGPDDAHLRSPLSPLTPSSPLHPDGLIAPIWIRKHTTLVPSVFVLFTHLYEYPPHVPHSPLDLPDQEREREREQEERLKDSELSAGIALRKKSTNERGIKLTVVLMASRRMLDDPSLDTRLTFIRRQSGLDSRAALFVLSPVSTAELGDFVNSLQQALYEPAIDYYVAHSKRVRRKRNRHSQAASSYAAPAPLPSASRPLRAEGWTVRYEYKMACFAEFRGEDEIALKHYQDAYSTLVIMFGSTAILPPRTKRWAEAKVLADCISIKICKLYLYNNEHALALSSHATHMRRFADFSRGWGIGEETFEFWSWLARQHRVLAELLEQGTRTTLTIPDHKPLPGAASPTPPLTASRVAVNPLEMDAMRTLGLNPSNALQHPGFYYYMAAKCTEKRRERFLAISEADSSASSAPGFSNERKVDHLTIILELYTKAYELFKKYSPGTAGHNQGRLTLWIAYCIAQTYYESEKYDMAVRFFERIAKTYRREKWGAMLRPLLATWYACAKQLGDVELSVRLLVEMLGHGDTEEPGALQDDLLAVLQNTEPSNLKEPLVVDLSEAESIFDSAVVFWAPEVKVDEPAAFQLALTAPSNVDISALPVSSLMISFSDATAPVVVRHVDTPADTAIQRVDVGAIAVATDGEDCPAREVQAYLRWRPGETVVFSGTMSSTTPTVLRIAKLLLRIQEGRWTIEVPLEPEFLRQGSIPNMRWLSSLDPIRFIPIARDNASTAIIAHRPHQLMVVLKHDAPAYVDEEYTISLDVTNTDDRALDVVVDVLLQPTEIEGAVNYVVLDEQRSTGLIKAVPLGVLKPGVNVVKTLSLISTGGAGDRTLDISIQSALHAPDDRPPKSLPLETPSLAASGNTSELLRTLVVPTVSPFQVKQTVGYKRAPGEGPGLSELATYGNDYWDDADGGEAIVTTTMECTGPWGVEVQSLTLVKQDNASACVLNSSSEDGDDGDYPIEYLTGDQFCDVCRVTLMTDEEDDYENGSPIPGPGTYELSWRRVGPDGTHGPTSLTRIPLPSLKPPRDGLVALLNAPPIARLHEPFAIDLTVRNRRPDLSANVVVQMVPTDGFVVAGLRSGRLPILLPLTETRLKWRLVPLECGHVELPQISVLDRRRASPESETPEGEVVEVVDAGADRIPRSRAEDVDGEVRISGPESSGKRTILVLP